MKRKDKLNDKDTMANNFIKQKPLSVVYLVVKSRQVAFIVLLVLHPN
ncbi:MAG: hypothetical protein IJD50_05710 [Clostridia bacterium]|nr:hypothetical protein [Clostridia bacterium]